MAGSVNKVILVGNLGRDPESRSFQNGGKVVNLRIATSESWKDRNSGERKEKTEWHSVAIFNEGLANVAERFLRKGSKVYIEGQLQTRKWQDQQGQDRYSTEVVLQGFNSVLTMLDGPGGGQGGGSGGGGGRDEWGGDDMGGAGFGGGGGRSGGAASAAAGAVAAAAVEPGAVAAGSPMTLTTTYPSEPLAPPRTAIRGWQVDEAARAAVIAAYDLEELRDSRALTRITDFAATLCGCPVALVTLLEETRQSFLSRTGTQVTETPRDIAFCQYTVLEDEVMVIPDLTADARFAANPLVTGDTHVRFYAGAPLVTDDGVPLGALCVLDTVTHPEGLTPLHLQGLETLAEAVMARLRDSRDAARWRLTEAEIERRLADSEQRFRTLADTMPQMVWSTLPDGFHDYYNARWYEFTGVPTGSTDGEAWNGMFHADDQERAWSVWRHSLATGEPYQIEYRLRHFDGTYRWVLGRALPIRDDAGVITRWFGTCTDIHEQKLALEERETISQELSHRIKNIFAVIAGLIGFAARGRPELAPVANDLRERITALGRAHDFVRPHSPHSRPLARQDSLRELLADLFAPYRRGADDIVFTGDDVAIDDRSATPLALLFHELATNATKYGALSVEGGRIEVSAGGDADEVVLTWRETGGPAVERPGRAGGFGSQLIELSAVRQLGGAVSRDWRRAGLVVTVTAPRTSFKRC